MSLEWRQDRGSLLTPRIREDGVMLVEGYAARPGVLEYKNADGTVTRELVTMETLRDSAAGLARAPLTLEHPPSDITPDNVQEYGVGDVDGEVVIQDDGYCRVKMAIRRRDAQSDVRNKVRCELSPGYHAEIDKTPGTHPEFGPYDAIQTARKYNHLAIVQDARGGNSIRIRTDSKDAAYSEHLIGPPPIAQTPHPTGARMNASVQRICRAMGVNPTRYDSDEAALDAVAPQVEDMAKEHDSDEESRDAEMAKRDEEIAQLKQRLEAAEAELDSYFDQFEQQDMEAMEPVAQDMGIEGKHDSSQALAFAIAQKMRPGLRLDSESEVDAVRAWTLAEMAVAHYYNRSDSAQFSAPDPHDPSQNTNPSRRDSNDGAPAPLARSWLGGN